MLHSLSEKIRMHMATGNFEAYGGYQRYCDLVGTCGVYEGVILILGAEDRDVFVFARSIGNGAPVQLDIT